MEVISKEELLNRKFDSLTMKDLRRFILENPQMEDSTPVMVQRIEDIYFEGRDWNGGRVNGWKVYLVEGEFWYSMERLNENMEEEIKNRKDGGEWQYPKIENPEEHKVEMSDGLKEQFHSSFCITKENDDSVILIYNHY